MSPSSYTHISVRDLYISRISLPILLQGNTVHMWENINRSQTHECGNWHWGRAIPSAWDYFSNIGHQVPKTLQIISPLAQCYQKSFLRQSTICKPKKTKSKKVNFLLMYLKKNSKYLMPVYLNKLQSFLLSKKTRSIMRRIQGYYNKENRPVSLVLDALNLSAT